MLIVLAVPVVLTACPGSHDDGDSDGQLVVGVQTSSDITSLIGAVHIVAKVDGTVADDETVQAPQLPKEITLHGHNGAHAEITVDGLQAGVPPNSPPITSRLATASLIAGPKKLLRILLDSRCLTLGGGGPIAPVCAPPQTCLSGRCQPAEVGPSVLEDYETTWATSPPDVCRPLNHGAPEVIIGQGQTDYGTLTDGQVLQLEKGPQGGHHIWIAARQRNLRQSGSITTITSTLEGDPAPVPPMAYVFTFDPDEGSYCKLYGLRYQVDAGATDLGTTYKKFLDKNLTVTVTVADSTGAKASSTRTVHIAPKLLCPDGTDSCNQ